MSIRINRELNGNQMPKNISNWQLDYFGNVADRCDLCMAIHLVLSGPLGLRKPNQFLKKPYKYLNDLILIPKLYAPRRLKIKINSNFHMAWFGQKMILRHLIELDKPTNKKGGLYLFFKIQQSASVISQRPNFTITDCSASANC